MQANLKSVSIAKEDEVVVANTHDIASLTQIAKSVFVSTRFFNDPLIEDAKAEQIYVQWIKNSVKGEAADLVLVSKQNDEITGFVTIQKNGHIPLIAVKNDFQGKGVGKKLIHAALYEFSKGNITTVEIETQMQNVPALRTYQTCGFKITGSFLTYRWSK